MSLSYVVKKGDCLSRIAARFGFADWRTIYDAPDNAEFKKNRPNPNLIYPGDVVEIPDRADKEIEVTAGQSHRFELKRKRTLVRIKVEVDEPHRYLFEVGAASFRGTTDGSSVIAHPVDPLATAGKIRLWPDSHGAPTDPPDDAIAWMLDVGALDPVDEVSGVQGRLSNLGYYDGPLNGEVDDLTAAAIRWFQDDEGIPMTGAIDKRLRDKLVEVHDKNGQ